MANLMDLIREIQGVRNQVAPGEGIAPGSAEPVNDTGVYEPGLQVEGAVARPAPVDQSQYLLSANGAPDLRNTEWAQAALEARQENDEKVQHKGMFGMKGTLREVLGVLGDAFLVQGGANPVYAPTRQRERVGDAMAGYTQSPRGAAERMTAIDPVFAQKMGEEIVQSEIARANAERMANAEATTRYEKGVRLFGGMLGAADAETYDRMKPILQRLKQSYGLGDEFQIPETYDPNYGAAISTGAINPYQQRTLEDADERIGLTRERNAVSARQGDERIAISRQNADTARKRMERSGSGGRPRADTELEYFRTLEALPPNQRSDEENAWVKKYTGQNTRGNNSTRRSVQPPSRLRVRAVRDK